MSSVKRNVVANYLATGWTAVLGLAMVPVYLRYVGVEAYGLLGFLITLQAWLFLLDMGMTPTFNREVARFSAGSRSPQEVHELHVLFRSLEIVYAIVAALMVAGFVLSSGWLATAWLNVKEIPATVAAQAVALTGLVVGLQWLGAVYRSATLGLQDQVWLSGLTASVATVRAAASVAVLAWISPTVTALVVVQVAASVVETLLLAWRVRTRLPPATRSPHFDFKALRRIWRFAASLAVITMLGTVLMQVDKLLLAKLLPLDEFGYFSLAVAIAAALGSLVAPMHNAAYPRLCELAASRNEQQMAREYHRFSQIVSLTVLPAMLVLSLFSHEVVLLWTQDPRTAGVVAPVLSLWVLGTGLNALMHVPYAAQLAYGWSRIGVIVNSIAVLVMVPAMLYWVPRHGVQAAAWIWIGLNCGYAVFMIGATHRRILRGEKWKWYLQDNLVPLLAGLAAAAPLAVLHALMPALSRPAEAAFVLGTGLATTLAVAIATPTGHAVLRSLGSLLKVPRIA